MTPVGIPRALLYHRYGAFWRDLWQGLGVETVLSTETNQAQLAVGCRLVPAEVCLPIKVLAGHVAELTTRTNTIFLPQFVTDRRGLYACPKMIGITDLMRLRFPGVRFITPCLKGNFIDRHLLFALRQTRQPGRAWRALRRAVPRLGAPEAEPVFPSDRLRVALLSHFYVVRDRFLCGDVLDVLARARAAVYTKEDLPRTVRERETADNRAVRWVYERELLNAFDYYLDRVDGICNVVSFGCGPDSLAGELMLRRAQDRRVPFLTLVIDEHTARAGIVTRLEAFVDVCRRVRATS